MRHGTFEYELDEFQPIKDASMYIYGHAVIEWEYDTPDRSVGETSGYGFSIGDIYISSSKSGKARYTVERDSALYDLIYKELMRKDEYILSAIERDDA